MLGSPNSSPVHKRQRLSSPTYDGMIDDLSQEDLEALQEVEAKYSQSTSILSASQPHLALEFSGNSHKVDIPAYNDPDPLEHKIPLPGFSSANKIPTSDQESNVLASQQSQADSLFASAASLTKAPPHLAAGFASARNIPLVCDNEYDQSQSSDAPVEPDYDSWFDTTSIPATVGFRTAKSVNTTLDTTNVGFKTAGNRSFLSLSADALQKASKLMKTWEQEVEDELRTSQASSSKLTVDETSNPFLSTSTPRRPILQPVENSPIAPGPGTPTPAEKGFSRAIAGKPATFTNAAASSGLDLKGKSKAFKSPLVIRNNVQHNATHIASPLNPGRVTTPSRTPKRPHPLSFATSPYPVSTAQIPRLGLTPIKANVIPKSTKKFNTPFKAGMRPGEPGRLQLEKEEERRRLEHSKPSTANKVPQKPTVQSSTHKGKRTERISFFNLSLVSNRRSLASSGFLPQSYNGFDLDALGINFSELAQITPDQALSYSFHSSMASAYHPSALPTTLGPSTALAELLHLGCSLATQLWVDNHWGLILWKLASLVRLDPESEREISTRRWCWSNVINQLLYRYERELNGGVRPPLRLIANQDTPASSPMILCVSNITWTGGGVADDGTALLPFPELEVTDGWYRLRAKVDEPIARAIRRKVIRVGRKIAVVGARLSSSKKEPCEILEAYDSVSLKLAGNSSHLARWHAKLGFQKHISVSTLHSLTPDGGNATLMNLVVMKVYPVGYLEFVEGEDGKQHKQGPRSEKDEAAIRERWKAKREAEESKLRYALENRLSKLEGYADRMEQKAGSRFRPGEDEDPPNHIEDIYDQLEDASMTEASVILGRLGYQAAGWLARLIREKVSKEREQSRDEFESELNSLCPPRQVRSFRVIVTRDARTVRKSTNRTAQITVWDVMNVVLKEGGKPGDFREGQTFMVTNLIPSQQSAWMAPDSDGGSEIYLSTRKDSRWTLMS